MKTFTGSSNKSLAQEIAQSCRTELSPLELSIFPDGERRIRILEKVVDEDCVIVQPTASPADINYMELFFIADALKRASAKSITAVIPYLGYQRQDHLFREGEAVSLEVVAKTLEAVGINRVIAFDFHSVRIPEVFSIPISHVSALPLFAQVIRDKGWNTQDTMLVSPDRGGVRRVKQLAESLDSQNYAVVEKKRDLDTGEVVAVHLEVPSTSLGVEGKRALIIDDMISSGATVIKAAELLKKRGVDDVFVLATHGIFASGASKALQESVIDKVFITDTVFIPESKKFEKLEILSVAEIIAAELQKFLI